jgi:hypothetical protein
VAHELLQVRLVHAVENAVAAAVFLDFKDGFNLVVQ